MAQVPLVGDSGCYGGSSGKTIGELLAEMQATRRFWLRPTGSKDAWREVSESDFIKAERAAGFYPKSGHGVATGGFSSTSATEEGEITYQGKDANA